jgi:hypothetical protein
LISPEALIVFAFGRKVKHEQLVSLWLHQSEPPLRDRGSGLFGSRASGGGDSSRYAELGRG